MSLDVGDLDFDGDIDVVAGEHDPDDGSNGRVFIYRNEGNGASWQSCEIDSGLEHYDGTQLIDIDKDGDLDILSIGWSHDDVVLYENLNGGSGDSGGGPDLGNKEPNVNVGWDATVTLSSGLTIDATATDDGQPNGALTYLWSQVSGPVDAVFASSTSEDTAVTFPAAGSYQLRLTVSGGALDSSDELMVTVNPAASGEIVTLALAVGHSHDDAEEKTNGNMSLSSSDLELTELNGNAQVIGLRFLNVTIPSGATVRSAYIQFMADEKSTEATDLLFAAEATDDPVRFTSTNGDVSARPASNATVSWQPQAWNSVGENGAKQRTPDLSSLVQETVGCSGWQAGNAMVFLIRGTGKRVAESYDGGAAKAAVLHIEYQTGGAGQ